MIITVTPNPSVDRTISIDPLVHGAVQRATANREDPGGKGINVSRALTLHGTPTTAVLPIGGSSGRVMTDLLAEAGVPVEPVAVAEAIRSNVALVEPDGTTTKINEPGPRLTQIESDALDATVDRLLPGAAWVVGCGSLPPGLSEDYFARLVQRAHAAGVLVAVDSSGMPMTHALAAHPTLIKPNRVELAEVVRAELTTVGAVTDAARRLVDDGIGQVVVSLGRDGALLVTADEVVHAVAHVARPVSTVGAGDSLLAGYLHALSGGATRTEALASGIAFGAAAVALPGSQMPTPEQVAAADVTVTPYPDPDMPLCD